MLYHVRHSTRYHYTAPISESVTEARMHPLTTEHQQCAEFSLHVRPNARIIDFTDHLGNKVHYFTQPGVHEALVIVAQADVIVHPRPPLPDALPPEAWDAIDALTESGEHWKMLMPSEFTGRTERLDALAAELDVRRRCDPLTLLLDLNSALNRTFAYDAASTRVDSPIDEALEHRRGVCQDLTHIMLALVRNYLRIPCRYISGYLYHRNDDRSADGATHAWMQAFLPGLGWVGFDPTNNLVPDDRHIEVAIGRDYHDAPPTRGVYKGNAGSELTVNVRIRTGNEAAAEPESPEIEHGGTPAYRSTEQTLQARYAQAMLALAMQIQQQQQQQQ